MADVRQIFGPSQRNREINIWQFPPEDADEKKTLQDSFAQAGDLDPELLSKQERRHEAIPRMDLKWGCAIEAGFSEGNPEARVFMRPGA